MIFPEFLYRLTAADSGKQVLEHVMAENNASAAAVTVGMTVFTVPADKVFLLTNTSAAFTPGATQNLVSTELLIADALGSRQWPYLRAASGLFVGGFSGDLLVPPTFRVRAQGVFSAGANVNQVEASCHGILIPRGSFTFRQEHV